MAGENLDSVYIEKVVNAFQSVTIPSLSGAYVSNIVEDDNQLFLTTRWNQRNYEFNKTDKYSILYNINKSEKSINKVSFPLPYDDFVIESISPSLLYRAVIIKHKNEASHKDDYIMEIWSNSLSKRVSTFNLTSFDKHGMVHSDALFGSLEWSKDENRVVYVAEKKKEKSCSYFDTLKKSESEKSIQGDKFEYEESWGEQLTEVTNAVLCIMNIQNSTLEIADGIPDDVCPLNPQFGPNNTLIFAGLQKTPFRLGAIYCDNRQSGIYLLKLDIGAVEVISTNVLRANFYPCVNKSKSKVVFFQRQLCNSGDPHKSVNYLVVHDLVSKTLKVRSQEFEFENKKIPMFNMGGNRKYDYWLADDIHIAIPNIYLGKNYVCIIDTDKGLLRFMVECSAIFGIHKSMVLGCTQRLNSEVCSLKIIDCTNPLSCLVVKEPEKIDNEIDCGSILDKNGLISFYLLPKKDGCRLPLLVSPHGGPHSLYTDNYNRNARLFCKLGYAVLLVNYRGSYGFTEESLKSLPGHIGTQDVKDVQTTVLSFIEMKKDLIDQNNIFISGGSHGGFLTAHLIGQYPDFYRAAAMRNPVIEICSMSIVSDIPDWTYFECGVSYSQDRIPSTDDFKLMLEKSPIIHTRSIKAPVLLCIGEKDARVPPSQGKKFFKLLKANNKVVKMLLYPNDCHPLANVETDGDSTINICKWFYQHTD